jgi:arsenate reductase
MNAAPARPVAAPIATTNPQKRRLYPARIPCPGTFGCGEVKLRAIGEPYYGTIGTIRAPPSSTPLLSTVFVVKGMPATSNCPSQFPIIIVVHILITDSSHWALPLTYTAHMPSFNPVVQRRLDALANELAAEFEGEFEADQVVALMADSAVRLAETAAIPDYLPPLAYRLTKERLRGSKRTGRPAADESRDIVFVSLSGGGRGQIAAALTTLLSGNKITVHSAGTAVHGQIDPVVSTAISELGIDVSEASARPITQEVLGATDVVVTMGHSVGVFDIPDGVRHEDWRVGDPVGAQLDEVRRVREDIERGVRTLLERLGVEATQ